MKNVVILVGNNGRPSIRQVYRRLRGGVLVETHPSLRMYLNNKGFKEDRILINPSQMYDTEFRDYTLIRWGCCTSIGRHKELINPMAGIANASNKAEARAIMYRAGVRVPPPVTKSNYKEAKYPIIGRPSYHNKGKSFHIFECWEELDHYYKTGHSLLSGKHLNIGYLSEFVDKDREFRVHVAGGKVIAVSEKPRQNSMKWNEVSGNEFFQVHEWPEDIASQAITAVLSIGLDSGGVDVILKDEKAYVLEVNSAPSLYKCEFEVEAYRKWFQSIIDS
jgi:glutathione synthase/RimK-type ligase-like ATP-grasp enzyme